MDLPKTFLLKSSFSFRLCTDLSYDEVQAEVQGKETEVVRRKAKSFQRKVTEFSLP